ncbi:nucleotide pyrophosphohydrolase [Kordiimonas sp.]|uniref:nucleotide pyrophosphohydrolase n=1 Tax=Kordiimonas sp. TaxID=1970157 RepID=UPI003A8E1689
MTETQESIACWAEETFGPVKDQTVLVRRAMDEMEELLAATEMGDKDEIGKETADIVILLHRLLELNQLDLGEEVTRKMAENRGRQWQAKGDGTGKHIPSEPIG